MNTGELIKKERMRLNYTQAAFAKACGVHRNTQIKYESGEREPDAGYLRAIASLGVDVGYVLTGNSEYQERQAMWRVLLLFQENLKLVQYDEELESVCKSALADVQNLNELNDKTTRSNRDTNALVSDLIKKSPLVMLDLQSVLEDLIEKVDFIVDITGWTLSPSSRGRVITRFVSECQSAGSKVSLDEVKKQLQLYRSDT